MNPPGYTLLRPPTRVNENGAVHTRIWGGEWPDYRPVNIVKDGRVFTRTGTIENWSGFSIYQEGWKTVEYGGSGE